VTATDNHNRTSSREFKVTLVPHADLLAFQLAAGDGGHRDWINPFWTDANTVNPQLAENYLTQNQDIRTQTFTSMRLGPRIRMEWILTGGIKAKAIYNVLPAFQDKTWHQIFSMGYNTRFATKDVLASTPGKPLVEAGYVSNNVVQSYQEVSGGSGGQRRWAQPRWPAAVASAVASAAAIFKHSLANLPSNRLATPFLTLMRTWLRTATNLAVPTK
jgi:hypothetical protein